MTDRPLWHALRTAGTALLLGALVVALALVVVLRMRGSDDGEAIETCRGWYARARTGAESAAVARRAPIISRAQAPSALACGTRRAAGQL